MLSLRRRIDLRLAFWTCALIVGSFQLTLVTLYDDSSSNGNRNGKLLYLLEVPPPRPAKRELKWKNHSHDPMSTSISTMSTPTTTRTGKKREDVQDHQHHQSPKTKPAHLSEAKTNAKKIKNSKKKKKSERLVKTAPKEVDVTNHIFTVDAQMREIQKAGKLYSIGRKDRSGSVITDQLFAHAFAFANNVEYAGACFTAKGLPKKDTRNLLSQLQWDSYLKFGCPRGDDVLSDPKAEFSPLVLKADVYRHNIPQSYFTKAWRDEIQRKLPKDEQIPDSVFQVAVHVRRGDVSPCRYKRRYLPNSHYLELIDKYIPNDRETQVTIFSESESFEPFDDFKNRGFDVQLDTELADVWKALAKANVTILSRSYFSFVPAAVNPNKVIYTSFFEFEPLESWEQADEDLVRRSDKQIREMYNNRCNATAIEIERQLQGKKHKAQR